MATMKQIQQNWLRGIIRDSYDLEKDDLSGFAVACRDIADTIKRAGCHLPYIQDKAEYYLRGLGLSAFPFYTIDHENLLKGWGYDNPSAATVERFWSVSAHHLLEILAKEGIRMRELM